MHSPDMATAALYDSNFKDRLGQVVNYTIAEESEAAFAMYHYGQELYASEVITGESLEPGYEDLAMFGRFVSGGVEAMRLPHTSVNRNLLTRRAIDLDSDNLTDLDGGLRDDIALLLHSHPLGRRSMNRQLCPSIEDLDEATEIEPTNTGYLEVIAVPEPKIALAGLFIYRRKDPNLPNMYGGYDPDDPPPHQTLLKAMHASGFTSTVIEYSLTDRCYTQDEAIVSQKIRELF